MSKEQASKLKGTVIYNGMEMTFKPKWLDDVRNKNIEVDGQTVNVEDVKSCDETLNQLVKKHESMIKTKPVWWVFTGRDTSALDECIDNLHKKLCVAREVEQHISHSKNSRGMYLEKIQQFIDALEKN